MTAPEVHIWAAIIIREQFPLRLTFNPRPNQRTIRLPRCCSTQQENEPSHTYAPPLVEGPGGAGDRVTMEQAANNAVPRYLAAAARATLRGQGHFCIVRSPPSTRAITLRAALAPAVRQIMASLINNMP